MKRKRARSLFVPMVLEALESRALLSGSVTAFNMPSRVSHGAAVDASAVKKAVTHTALEITTGTLGQPTVFTVTVSAGTAAGPPVGTVNLLDHGKLIQTLTLVPTSSANAKFAESTATYTLTPTPGGSAYFFGNHAITAVFVPSGAFTASTSHKTFNVGKPAYTTLSDGVKVATIVSGSGAAIQSGQTANVLYTGYLAKNGKIFDDSAVHGGTPFSFPVGGGTVIAGFDAASVGMKVGETRLVLIPPALGYGRAGSPPTIPANATLLFVLTLESIT